MQIYNLWDEKAQEDVIMEYYEPLKKLSDAAVIIFPGADIRGWRIMRARGMLNY